MEEISNLLKAIAALLWPLLAFTILFLFKKEVAEILKRLKGGRFFGQEIELNESLVKLDLSASAIQQEVSGFPETGGVSEDQEVEVDPSYKILAEATRSPQAALILLSAELEKLARQLLASTGFLKGRNFISLSQAIRELNDQYGLPKHVATSLKDFMEVRNYLVHGQSSTSQDIMRAIDSGLVILKSLKSLPTEKNIVFDIVDIYSDPACTKKIQDAKGIILLTKSPGNGIESKRIFPSTRQHFLVGKTVSWEWNLDKTWHTAWYRDPTDGMIKEAWRASAEFIGRSLDDI